jgi:uncharacterized protein DUF1036
MALFFHNATGSTIDLAYAEYDSSCSSEGQPYVKRGWYIISPGETQKVWNGWAGGESFYYYAESATGRWSGPHRSMVHPRDAFEWCWDAVSTAGVYVGFRAVGHIDPWVVDRTVRLTS